MGQAHWTAHGAQGVPWRIAWKNLHVVACSTGLDMVLAIRHVYPMGLPIGLPMKRPVGPHIALSMERLEANCVAHEPSYGMGIPRDSP